MKNKKPVFSKQFSFYMTQEQYDAMIEGAAKKGQKVSVYLREALTEKLSKK